MAYNSQSNEDLHSIVAALSPAACSLQAATTSFHQISLCAHPSIAPEFAAIVDMVCTQATYCGNTLFPASQRLVQSLETMLRYYTHPRGMYYWERNIDTIAEEAARRHVEAVWVAAQCQIVAANVKVAEGGVPWALQATHARGAAFEQKRKVRNVKAFVKKAAAVGTGFVGAALAIPTLGISLVALPAAFALDASGEKSAEKALVADACRTDCELACAALDGSFSSETARFEKAMVHICGFFALLENEVGTFSGLAGSCSRELVKRRREKHWYKMQGKATEILQACAALNRGFTASIPALQAIAQL